MPLGVQKQIAGILAQRAKEAPFCLHQIASARKGGLLVTSYAVAVRDAEALRTIQFSTWV
jgi:hypothetical protein